MGLHTHDVTNLVQYQYQSISPNMEWAESRSEPMKSRLFIDYIIKTLHKPVFEKPGSFDGCFLSISSTKDPLWFSTAPIYCYEHYINCSNKTEIAIR